MTAVSIEKWNSTQTIDSDCHLLLEAEEAAHSQPAE